MHAALVSVTIDEGQEDEARRHLDERVVPMLKGSAGFVGGYWFAPKEHKGWAVVLYDTEEAARAAAPPVGERVPDAPVVIDHIEYREVIASA
jgi:hypothetical protein